jgi:triose/dihydroxyacetone kinase / FAD-AMP lyase (cyclizing)
MLHSAICGDIFASPSVDKILNMILLTGDPHSNILLIVKNYTGDRLNFGLALEIAKLSFGYTSIQILLVDDDCSIDESQVQTSVGRRGLAGTVLIHKIAGAMSEQKFTREQIYQTCRSLLDNRKLITMGFSFSSTLTSLSNIEIGKGIHGEPGVLTIDKRDNFDEIIEVCYKKFEKHIPPGSHICIMINNLGGTSLHLVNVFTLQLLKKFNESNYKIEKILSGCFLSSLSQEGLSVTLLDVSQNPAEFLSYLNHAVNVPAGLFAIDGSNASTNSESIIDETSHFPSERAVEHLNLNNFVKNDEVGIEIAKNILTFVCEALISCEEMLNKIDSELGTFD